MKKQTIIVLILISVLIGYVIGSKLEVFSPRTVPYSRPKGYIPKIPGSVAKDSLAFSEVVRVISPSVVNISTTKNIKDDFSQFFNGPFGDFFDRFHLPKRRKEQNLGSGVIVSPEGYIITNSHVVEKADEIKVTLFDKQDYKGKVIGSDSQSDIAVVKISAKGLPAITWGDSESLQVGEFVLAFGNPYGFSHTVTMGIVSAIGRADVGITDYEDFIQTDAAINPGNSGGPLVNVKGELVGVNTAIFSRTGGYQGIGFAVPSNMARLVMDQLVNEGKVRRGWLGVTIQSVTPALAKEFGLKQVSGAIVSEVFKGSPAEKAGLKRGDVILEVNGKSISDVGSLRNIVSQSEIGSRINLKIMRDEKTVSLTAVVQELPREVAEVSPEDLKEDSAGENALAGFSVTELTSGIAKQLGLLRDEEGVVIVRVEPYSPADEAGLKKGDVIQEMNRKKVGNLRDFNNITNSIKKDDSVLLFINRGGKKIYITLKVSA